MVGWLVGRLVGCLYVTVATVLMLLWPLKMLSFNLCNVLDWTNLDLTDTMVVLPDTMVHLSHTMVDLPETVVDLSGTLVDLPITMIDLHDTQSNARISISTNSHD